MRVIISQQIEEKNEKNDKNPRNGHYTFPQKINEGTVSMMGTPTYQELAEIVKETVTSSKILIGEPWEYEMSYQVPPLSEKSPRRHWNDLPSKGQIDIEFKDTFLQRTVHFLVEFMAF
jgi:hypothetical protein